MCMAESVLPVLPGVSPLFLLEKVQCKKIIKLFLIHFPYLVCASVMHAHSLVISLLQMYQIISD